MGLSATIPVSEMNAANEALEALGFGPDNFSVPLRTGSVEATHAGLHAWNDAEFRAAVVALPYAIEITEGRGVTFPAHVATRALKWSATIPWPATTTPKGGPK